MNLVIANMIIKVNGGGVEDKGLMRLKALVKSPNLYYILAFFVEV